MARKPSKTAHLWKLTDEDTIAVNAYPMRGPHERHCGMKIVWLMAEGQNQNRVAYLRRKLAELDPALLTAVHILELKTSQWYVPKPGTKNTKALTKDYQEKIQNQLARYLDTAACVVVNNFPMLEALLGDSTGTGSKGTTADFRGSVYSHALTNGLPTIVVDALDKCYVAAWKQDVKAGADPQACEQLLELDLQKVWRFWKGQEHQDAPFQYAVVVGNRNAVGSHKGTEFLLNSTTGLPDAPCAYVPVKLFLAAVGLCTAMSVDFETSMGGITCMGVSLMFGNPSNIISFTVPYVNTLDTETEGQEWMTWDEFQRCHATVCQSRAPKWYANGSYDAHYHIKAGIAPVEPIHDVIHLWHSYRHRLPKSLATITSVMSDQYYYWKDEIKGGSKEKVKQVKYAVPVTHEGIHTYWRYCALDCHNTLLSGIRLAGLMCQPNHQWVLDNYAREMALQYGPLMKASYMGCRLDTARLEKLVGSADDDAESAAADLLTASAGIVTEGGNNNQVIEWLYHTLGAKPPKQRKDRASALSVDQKQLQLVSEQHPIYASAIHYLRQYRKPNKQGDMYGKLKHQWGRFQYKYAIAGTYTGRLSGKASDFWVGTNPMNIPASLRSFVRADEGKVMIDIDYSQADLYHFAVAVGDKNMIRNVFDDRDTHAVHVETILRHPYDEVTRGKKAGEDWVTDPITGCRQIIKKLTHGGNYGMMGNSAYLNAGRDALDTAAETLGISTAGWQLQDYYNFINYLLKPYFQEYHGQIEFRDQIVKDCIANNGLSTCFGGHTVYFQEHKRPRDKDSLMRALLAFYGQGGTASMINIAMLGMYYRTDNDHASLPADARSFLDHYNIDLLLQTHDSITYQLPIEALAQEGATIVELLLHYMEIKCNFNDMEYTVPCEVNIGSRWSKAMPEVKRTASKQDIIMAALDHFIYEGDI